jgi:5'-nucleotidase
VAPDAAVSALVQRAVAAVAPVVGRPVATIAAPLTREGTQYPLGNLIADAMRAEGKADVAVMNNGGIRANLRGGPATYGSLFEIQPFGNVLYRFTVSGAALRDYLEKLVDGRLNVHMSGAVVTYDSAAAPGARVRGVRVGGTELRPDGEYTLLLNDFLATGGDGLGLGSAARRMEVLPLVDLDAFIAYLRGRPQPVQGPTDARFVVTGPAR